jgi:hypothetical protein
VEIVDKVGWGRVRVREDCTLCIIGNNVVTLFPSLESASTGKILRDEVTRSTMNVDGFNVKIGLKYIAMNEKLTSNLEPLRTMLPWRLTKTGIQPSMKSKWVNNKEVLDDNDWVYPPVTPTLQERRLIMGQVAEIGTSAIFEQFCYKFGGNA